MKIQTMKTLALALAAGSALPALAADSSSFLGAYRGKTGLFNSKDCQIVIARKNSDVTILAIDPNGSRLEVPGAAYYLDTGVKNGANPIPVYSGGGPWQSSVDAYLTLDRDGKIFKALVERTVAPFGRKSAQIECRNLIRVE